MANAFIGSQHIWPRVVLSPIAKMPYLQSSQNGKERIDYGEKEKEIETEKHKGISGHL